jgi:hypothetical protein
VSTVVGALLAVVVGQALLANGQVRLSSLQHELTLEQSAHRQGELAAAGLETPSRIVTVATGQLQMLHGDVIQLPYISLDAPLPTPKVTPAPAPPPAPASPAPTANTGSASSAAAGSAASASASTATTTATSTP